MSSPSPDAVHAEVEAGRMKVGNIVAGANGAAITTPSPLFISAAGVLAASLPVVMYTGATNTGISMLSLQGSATNTANDLMHLTLVKGANATATIAGYYRVTVTDDNGVITNGDYYAPFYTLA